MKGLMILMLIVAGLGTVQTTTARTEDKEKETKASQGKVLICTDLMAGIRKATCNLGFSYRFHPHWSVEAEAGINPGILLWKENSELAGHNAELEAGRTGIHKDNKKGKRPGKQICHHERLGLCYWPAKGAGGPYFSANMHHSHNGKPGLMLGAGWQIVVGRHLGIRLEAAAGLINMEKMNFNDCIAVRIGYRF